MDITTLPQAQCGIDRHRPPLLKHYPRVQLQAMRQLLHALFA
jgi:hypothetical protein